jgi:hypothetical protein
MIVRDYAHSRVFVVKISAELNDFLVLPDLTADAETQLSAIIDELQPNCSGNLESVVRGKVWVALIC